MFPSTKQRLQHRHWLFFLFFFFEVSDISCAVSPACVIAGNSVYLPTSILHTARWARRSVCYGRQRLADVSPFHTAAFTGLLIHLPPLICGSRLGPQRLHIDFKIKGKCINRGSHMVHPITDSSATTQLINRSLADFPVRLVEEMQARRMY